MSLRLEDELRAALQAGTERLTAPPDSYARVMETVEAHRRRRRTVIAGSGVAVLAIAAMIGVGAGLGDQGPRRGTPATEQLPDQPSVWRGLPFSWPARGELGTDPEFADEFARRFGADHHLLYAEDGEAGRVVVAVSSAQEAVVFHGPRGEGLDELDRVSRVQPDSRQVAVALPHDDGHLVLVLLPGNVNDAQISAPTVQRDGSIDRQWRQLEVDGGVGRALTTVPPWVAWIRSPAGGGSVAVAVGPGSDAPRTLTCGDPCDGDWFAGPGLSEFRAQVATVFGASTEDITARLVLDAPVPAGSGAGDAAGLREGRLVAYVATLPSGGLVRSTYLVTIAPGGPQIATVDLLAPLPEGDANGPVFIPSTADRPALIVAPGASRVDFTPGRDAAPLPDAVLTDGVGVVTGSPPDIRDYMVTAYDAEGAVRGRWHGLVVQADNPFDAPTDG